MTDLDLARRRAKHTIEWALAELHENDHNALLAEERQNYAAKLRAEADRIDRPAKENPAAQEVDAADRALELGDYGPMPTAPGLENVDVPLLNGLTVVNR